jgi:hypothetical protein
VLVGVVNEHLARKRATCQGHVLAIKLPEGGLAAVNFL